MSKYHKKFLENGELNPKWKPRNPAWKKQPSGKHKKTEKPSREFFDSLPKSSGKSFFKNFPFRAFDGEGAEVDGVHKYILLNNSDKQCIYNCGGLDSVTIFDYLLECHERDPKRVNVVFAGNYDANLWLRDVEKEDIERISEADGKYYVSIFKNRYQVRFVPRKYFAIKRPGQEKAFVIWDVFGFFQSSFLKAMETWLPGDDRYSLIKEGKEKRSNFDNQDIAYIKQYCDAELSALVDMMDKLRQSIKDLDLVITRFDGAGSIASAIFKKHDVKKHIAQLPDQVQIAAQHAYFGGRIEIGKFGRHEGRIYNYDINSAYPFAQHDLPSLAHGEWIKRGADYDPRSTDNKMIVCLVKWSGFDNDIFCPFPYRSQSQNKVLFPSCGLNWIWKPEIAAALDIKERHNRTDWHIEILDCYEFVPGGIVLPFYFLADYYEHRKALVETTKRTGIFNGAEKTIKLGVNSAYGKTAQKAGYDEKTDRKPPYHNIAYAGIITSATRARLWLASQQCQDKIIALATDGVYSTQPLDLYTPKEKILGQWEKSDYSAMTLVQAGFYWLEDDDELISYSRGFDKMINQADMRETLNKVINAWNKKESEVYLPCTRFITMKTALSGGDWWGRWCTWHSMKGERGQDGRRLALTPYGTKRRFSRYGTPNKKMTQTYPQHNLSPELMSSIYTLPWENDINETAIDLEHADTTY